MQKNTSLKKIIQTALLIAITLILRNFSYMFYFGGGTGMRVGIDLLMILPLKFIALVCKPPEADFYFFSI